VKRKILHLGAGHNPYRYLNWEWLENREGEYEDITLDIAEACKPDILFDLNTLREGEKLPLEDESIEQIHAYEVLEHFGTQGDWKGFFKE